VTRPDERAWQTWLPLVAILAGAVALGCVFAWIITGL
jgi:glycerol uptake facilitator-like aquaporin